MRRTGRQAIVIFKVSTDRKLWSLSRSFVIQSLTGRRPQLQPWGTSCWRTWQAEKENRCVTVRLLAWSVIYSTILYQSSYKNNMK